MIKLRNDDKTSKEEILKQMSEPRPLPMGRQQFEEWSDRIISGACMDASVTHESQKFALAGMLMHLGQTESHKPDAYFIHSLRVCAIKQVALEMTREINASKKSREDAEKPADSEAAPAGAN